MQLGQGSQGNLSLGWLIFILHICVHSYNHAVGSRAIAGKQCEERRYALCVTEED